MARAPGDMPSGYCVAGTINASLRPIDQRQKRDFFVGEEFEDEFQRILAIELAPQPRPGIAGFVTSNALPVAPGQLRRVLDAQPPLMRRVDHVDAAEGLFGQAAQVFPRVFVNEQDAAPGRQQLVSRHQAGQSSAGLVTAYELLSGMSSGRA